MRSNEQRINIIIGQLEAVKKMLEKKDSCFTAVIQLKAIRSAVSSLMNKVLAEEIDVCFSKKCPSNEEKIKKALSELAKNN